MAETGPGVVEDYLTHPLNFAKSPAVAQVLRGLTGLLAVFGVGSLRLAVLDVALGLWQALRRRPPAGGGVDGAGA